MQEYILYLIDKNDSLDINIDKIDEPKTNRLYTGGGGISTF